MFIQEVVLAIKSPDQYLRQEKGEKKNKNYRVQGPILLAAAKAGEKRFHPCDKGLRQMRGAR